MWAILQHGRSRLGVTAALGRGFLQRPVATRQFQACYSNESQPSVGRTASGSGDGSRRGRGRGGDGRPWRRSSSYSEGRGGNRSHRGNRSNSNRGDSNRGDGGNRGGRGGGGGGGDVGDRGNRGRGGGVGRGTLSKKRNNRVDRIGIAGDTPSAAIVEQVLKLAEQRQQGSLSALAAFSGQAIWELVDAGETSKALETTQTLIKEHRLAPSPRVVGFIATGLFHEGKTEKAMELLSMMSDEHGVKLPLQKLLTISKELISSGKLEETLALADYFFSGRGGGQLRRDFTTELVMELSRKNHADEALVVYKKFLDAGYNDEYGGILNVILREISKKGAWGRVLEVLQNAQKSGVMANESMVEATVKGLAVNGRMEKAIELLKVLKRDGKPSARLQKSLEHVARGYAQKGAIGELERFISNSQKDFGVKPTESQISDLLIGYARRGRLNDALSLVDRMKEEYGCAPSDLALEKLVVGLMSQGATEKAVAFISATEEAFGKKPTVEMANVVVGHLAQRGQVAQATEFVSSMRDTLQVTPDDSTLAALVSGLFFLQHSGGILERVAELSREMSIQPAHRTVSALVEGFGELGEIDRAHDLIDAMEDIYGIKPDRRCLRSLLTAFCSSNDADRAFGLLEGMEEVYGIQPFALFTNSVAGAFAASGRMKHVMELLDAMQERYQTTPSSATLKNIVHGLQKLSTRPTHLKKPTTAEGEGIAEALNAVVKKFSDDFGVAPEVNTLLRMVSTFCGIDEMEEAQRLVDTMEETYGIRPDTSMITTLVAGYSRRGDSREARKQMKRCEAAFGISPDQMTYNALVRGYCIKGQMFEALECVDEMVSVGLTPDAETVNHLALGHKRRGELKKAQETVQLMLEKHGVVGSVRSMNQLVDAHIKAGSFDEAKALALSLESSFGLTPSAVTVNLLIADLLRNGDPFGADAIAQTFYTSFRCSPSLGTAQDIVGKMLQIGAEDQAVELITSLGDRYGISPSSHMISRLVRFKLLKDDADVDEAVDTLLKMPGSVGLTPFYPELMSRIVSRWSARGKVSIFKEFVWKVASAAGCQPTLSTVAALVYATSFDASYADAASLVKEVESHFGIPPSAEFADEIVSAMAHRKDMAGAEEAFAAVQKDFDIAVTQKTVNFLVEGYAEAGNTEDALRWANTVADYPACPSSPKTTLECLVRGYVEKGEMEQAERLLQSDRFPVSAGAFMPFIERAASRGDIRRVQECLDYMTKVEVAPPIEAWNVYIAAALEFGGPAARDSAYTRMTTYGAVPDGRTFSILRRQQ